MPPKKRKKKRFLQKRYILLMIVLTYIVYAFGTQYLTLRSLDKQYVILMEEKQRLLATQNYLQVQRNYMLSNAFVELAARKELGFVKPGEHVILSAKPGEVPLLKPVSPEEIH